MNQHPKISHSFILREIAALEARGWRIDRIAIRGAPPGEATDETGAEAARTHRVLDRGALRLVADAVAEAVRAPRRFAAAARAAWAMGARSERGRFVHMIYLCEAAHVARRLRATGAGHLHAHFGTNAAAVARLAARLAGLPWSFTVHGPEEFDAPRALSLPGKMREAAFTVAISHFGVSQLRRWSADDGAARIALVRCGLDLGAFDAAAGPDPGVPAAPALVCVGRLSEQKGHSVLLEAAARVARSVPGFRLTLVGDGELRAGLEARIAALGLGETVAITGWADGAQVQAQIRGARALVLASFAEGLPVVIMEAFALHRPAIATWVAGIPELLDEACGWRVPAGDVDALAAAMIDAVTAPPDRLAAMGQAARRRVETAHDIRSSAEALERLMLSAQDPARSGAAG